MSDNLLPPRSKNGNANQPDPGPLPSHLKKEFENRESASDSLASQPHPAHVSGRYCANCDKLISVDATTCHHCHSSLGNLESDSTPKISTKTKRRRATATRHRGQRKKADGVGLQLLKMFAVSAVFGIGFLIYWSMKIPVGDGFVKADTGDSFLVYVHRLKYVVEVPEKNTDGRLEEDAKVQVSRQWGTYHAKRLTGN